MTDAERLQAQELLIAKLQQMHDSNQRHIGRLQRQLREAAYDPAEALFQKPKGQGK